MPNAQTIFQSFYNNTVSSTPLSMEDFGFTTAELGRASSAHIVIETAAIRYGFGFHAIDAGVGKIKNGGEEFIVEGAQNLKNILFVANTGTDALVHVDIAN